MGIRKKPENRCHFASYRMCVVALTTRALLRIKVLMFSFRCLELLVGQKRGIKDLLQDQRALSCLRRINL